jgi:hypothetical protein
MRTMCSPTHNAAAITIGYPPANLPPSERATQMPQATSSACSPAYSPIAPRAADHLVPSQQTRDPMQIKSLATYLKTYVIILFPYSPRPLFTPLPTVGGRCSMPKRRRAHPFSFSLLYSFYGQRLSGISRCGAG